MKELIRKLNADKSTFVNPDEAISAAESINRLSSDIYTDRDRFVYELLQNADDANNTEELIISIGFIENFMFFSHNGKEFSKGDLKSICSIGDGGKTSDKNKTGYKGIGFKSVFAISNCVIIKSGSCYFKFDKEEKIFGDDNWDSRWGDETEKSNWKEERKNEGKSDVIKMPWQKIPINLDNLPNGIECKIVNESNVSTILLLSENESKSLKREIKKLFEDINSRILLFLRSENIKVNIQIDGEILIAEKRLDKDVVHLKTNCSESSFLVKKTSLNIPERVRKIITEDRLIPEKLKEAKECEMGFAIEISSDDSLKKLASSNLYTYLPTSIELKIPFLLNSNFITDAGRQHIHKDIKWNRWLFRSISKYYLHWVQELMSNNNEYHNSILNVIPRKIANCDVPFDDFNKGYSRSLKIIPFIPNKNRNKLLKISEAIYDETGLSEIMTDKVIDFMNEKYKCEYTEDSFISKSSKTLLELGVKKFSIEELVEFISSPKHNTKENSNELLLFLFEKFSILEEYDIQELKEIKFIYNQKNSLELAKKLFLKSSYEVPDEDILYVCDIYVNALRKWFNKLGINEISDKEYIEKTVLKNGNNINKENAVKIGRILFDLHKKNELDYEKDYKLLSKGGRVQNAREMYLSDFYNPELKLEKLLNKDIYVSDKYCGGENDSFVKEEWRLFFRKIGVGDNIACTEFKLGKDDCKNRFDSELLKKVIDSEDKNPKHNREGYHDSHAYNVEYIEFYSLSLIQYVIDNYKFSKIFCNNVFGDDKYVKELKNKNIMTRGYTGYHSYRDKYQKKTQSEYNYFNWLIESQPLFPTLDEKCKKTSDIFINTKENIEIAAPYLPVLDYDGIVSDDWKKALKFKETFNLNDLLHILELVWKNEDNKDNVKKRVSKIYDKIIALGYVKSEGEKLKSWGTRNKLLTKDCKSYDYPNSLHLITVDGFINNNIVYSDSNCNNDIIELMRAFGVKVTDHVDAQIGTIYSEEYLSNKLLEIAPLISLLKDADSQNICQLICEIKRISFYKTDQIRLSYGDDSDTIERSWYHDKKKDVFYYVGDISYAKIFGFIEPLSQILKIEENKSILGVILMSNYEDGKNFMRENGYDISYLDKYEERALSDNIFNLTLPTFNYQNEDENHITGYTGEYLVYKWLIDNGYTNVKALNMVNEENKQYKISINGEAHYFRDSGCHYDIECNDNSEAKIFIEVKSTKGSEKVIENMPISPKEWELIGRRNSDKEKYLLFRVFNARSNNPQIYIINAEKVDD